MNNDEGNGVLGTLLILALTVAILTPIALCLLSAVLNELTLRVPR